MSLRAWRGAERLPRVVSLEFQAPQIKAAFGKAVAACRHETGLSQEELAYKSGIAAKNISRMECGDGNPTYFTLKRLADGLGIAASKILACAEQVERDEMAVDAKSGATDPKTSAIGPARKKTATTATKPRTPVRERRAKREDKSEDAAGKP